MENVKIKPEGKFIPFAAAVLSVAVSALLLLHSDRAAEAVRRGIEICGAGVIPSLFPMMFMSQYIVHSGAAEAAGTLLEKPARLLFGLPGVCGVALLTSFIGGYPAGAKAAETLVSEGRITSAEGKRLVNMAFCAGPGFAIGMVGGELYKNKTVGLMILTAQAISGIIIGIVYRLLSGRDDGLRFPTPRDSSCGSSRSDAMVKSAAGTASALLHMCSFIILFQVMVSMLELTGVNAAIGALSAKCGMGTSGAILIPCLMEVTGGSIRSVEAGLPFTAFVVGFGGLSVHFQNFAVCPSVRPDKALYIFTRAVQGALCSLMVSLWLRLPCFAETVLPVSGNVKVIPASFSSVSVGFGGALLVMCLMSVICLPSEKENALL
ncbi:MAG: hypothetical protein IJM51_04335 [Clostridia bacterium]|nr:hypothetical protein [Clostridia bacterium]